jgi:hypothetical protein
MSLADAYRDAVGRGNADEIAWLKAQLMKQEVRHG